MANLLLSLLECNQKASSRSAFQLSKVSFPSPAAGGMRRAGEGGACPRPLTLNRDPSFHTPALHCSRSFSNRGGSPSGSALGALNLVEHWPGAQRLHPGRTHRLLQAHPHGPHPQGPPSLLRSKGVGAANREGAARAAAREPGTEQREASPAGPRLSPGEKSRCLY